MRQNLNVTSINNNLKTRYNNKSNPTFKNSALLSTAFMAMDKHEIIGVSLIDLTSMVIPRSAIDFTRNKEAGIETAIREGSSTATHGAIGLAGLGAATLLALGLKKKNYNVDFKNITANNDTVDGMAQVFKSIVDKAPATATKEELSKQFLNKIFEDVQGLAGNVDNGDKKLWYRLTDKNQTLDKEVINVKNKIVEILLNQQKNSSYKLDGNILDKLEAYMNIDIPSTKVLQVNLGGKTVKTEGVHFLADAHSLTKAFTQDKVIESFRNAKDSKSVAFIKDLEKLGIRKTILGLAAICGIALSMQTINRHLTKKRTGIDGFVGDPDYEKKIKNQGQNSEQCKHHKHKDPMFIPLKILSILGMGFFIFKTLNAHSLNEFISNIQFKGNLPTMNQIKVVYGSTILGRLFAASDKNELRESSFRDFLGFTNFLILGSLVTKWFVNRKDKSLINYDPTVNGKGLLNWLRNSTIKTRSEVINSTLKNNVITDKGVIPLKEIYKHNWIQKGGSIAEKLSVLNKAKLVGFLYSCIALGIVVPLINKHMTESKRKKQKEAFKEQSENMHVSVKNEKQDEIKNEKLNDKTQKIINEFLKNN